MIKAKGLVQHVRFEELPSGFDSSSHGVVVFFTTGREFGDPQLVLPFSSEIDLLMYSTFAVQSGESARQQRLALVLSYVLWWSIGERSHLENAKGWTNPASCRVVGRTH